MFKWIEKRRFKLRPSKVSKRAKFIVTYFAESEDKDTLVYSDAYLTISFDSNSKIEITWKNHLVFVAQEYEGWESGPHYECKRYNYHKDWLEELNMLYFEVKSKTKRKENAKFVDMFSDLHDV